MRLSKIEETYLCAPSAIGILWGDRAPAGAGGQAFIKYWEDSSEGGAEKQRT